MNKPVTWDDLVNATVWTWQRWAICTQAYLSPNPSFCSNQLCLIFQLPSNNWNSLISCIEEERLYLTQYHLFSTQEMSCIWHLVNINALEIIKHCVNLLELFIFPSILAVLAVHCFTLHHWQWLGEDEESRKCERTEPISRWLRE